MNAASKAKVLPLRPTSSSIVDGLREEAREWRKVAAAAQERSLVGVPVAIPEVGVIMTAAEAQSLAVATELHALGQAEAYELAVARYEEREAALNASPRAYRRAS